MRGRSLLPGPPNLSSRPKAKPSSKPLRKPRCATGLEYPVVKLLDYAAQDEVLERDTNPFAPVVQAHLNTLQTRQDPEGRRVWKLRLVRSLYERGYQREDVQQLFRFIDWLMELPGDLDEGAAGVSCPQRRT